MDKKTEALKLALEALEKTQNEGYNLPGSAIREAITAIEEALAQPKEPEQEPVEKDWRKEPWGFGEKRLVIAQENTTPPQRTWVGLTNEERANCWETVPELAMRKVEAKLKEKNNG